MRDLMPDFGDYVAGGFEDFGEGLEDFGQLVYPFVLKALNDIGVAGQDVSNNLAHIGVGPPGLQAANAVTRVFIKVQYDSELIVEGAADDAITGFGLISSTVAPYIVQPSNNNSSSSGIPGYESYVWSTGLNLIGRMY